MKRRWPLIIILALAAVLRLWGLSRGDTINDEVFYAFRGLGMLDFDEAAYQKTPLEWFDPLANSEKGGIPWWTSLSFHDHPPLFFLLEHYSLKIFGDNNFGIRFPSVVFGVLSVYLLYLLGRKLFSEKAGLISAVILAATLNHNYISRLGLQESGVIFFLLLASYLFLRVLERDRYFIWTGVALGLGALLKYNLLVLVPFFLTYLVWRRWDCFTKKNFWLGTVLVLVIFSPVLIYNYKMYKAAGHFDFQFSYIFGQDTPEWQVQPGKEIGSISTRLKNFIPRLLASNSWILLLVLAVSLVAGVAKMGLDKDWRKKFSFLGLEILFLLLLLLLIGPSYRFLTMLTPFLILTAGTFLEASGKKLNRRTIWLFFIPWLGFEIFYTYNNIIAYYPVGSEPWLASKVRYENYNWGYNELDRYLKNEFSGRMPLLTFDVQYQFLEDIRQKTLAEQAKQNLTASPFLIVYGGNFDDGGKLWVMERRFVYQAWPILRLEDYFREVGQKGENYFFKAGFNPQYFILSTNFTPDEKIRKVVAGVTPVEIKNPRGDTAFLVYKKSASFP